MPEESPKNVQPDGDGSPPQNEHAEGESVVVRLKWGASDHLTTIYVNHLNINHSGPEFFVTFGELKVAPFLDKSELPEELEIEPKVRLAIAPDAMNRMVDVLQENVQTYLHKKEEGKK